MIPCNKRFPCPFFTESLHTANWHFFYIYYLRNWRIQHSNLFRISVLNSTFTQRTRIQPNLGFVDDKPYRTLDSQIRTCTNPNPNESNLNESSRNWFESSVPIRIRCIPNLLVCVLSYSHLQSQKEDEEKHTSVVPFGNRSGSSIGGLHERSAFGVRHSHGQVESPREGLSDTDLLIWRSMNCFLLAISSNRKTCCSWLVGA